MPAEAARFAASITGLYDNRVLPKPRLRLLGIMNANDIISKLSRSPNARTAMPTVTSSCTTDRLAGVLAHIADLG
jgi:hypothetical protein